MQLRGSCHCQAVRFTVQSHQPYPFMRCYCSICRKTAGGGGFAVNLGADNATLAVEGSEHVSVYQAHMADGTQSAARRHFCRQCGSALWLWDPRWPELVHPHASAIDSALPVPPEYSHIMLGSRAGWVELTVHPRDWQFDEYPEESLADWHRRLGLER